MHKTTKVRIIFISGSLEPGCDGVGDYTRQLAGELIKRGHEAELIALNDKYIDTTIESIQEVCSIKVPVLRIAYNLPDKLRIAKAKNKIDTFNPLWISLQFVPFSYQSKGLPFNLSRQLYSIGKGRKWHIMFHELWVGMENTASLKYVCWGMLQKQAIKLLLKKLNPHVVHTQTKLYQLKLNKLGKDAKYLPLFSNIPVVSLPQNTLVSRLNLTKEANVNLSLIVFGSIHNGAPIIEFSKEASIYSKCKGINLILKIIGRCGKEQDEWIKAWQQVGLPVEVLGELPAETISILLSQSSFGIATTPIELLEKSGSFAAMRAHGLPVISLSKAWKSKEQQGFNAPSGVVEYKFGNFEACIIGNSPSSNTTVTAVSNLFIDSLRFLESN